MAKPVLSSKTRTAATLMQYAENVFTKTTENADLFPDPIPTLSELAAGIQAYRISLTEAAFRDMRQVELKNEQMAKLKKLLYNLSLYVQTIAQGNAAIILAAGFIPSKTSRNTAMRSPKPTDFRVEIPQTGLCTVNMRVKPWSPARFYRFEYRKTGIESDWTEILTGKPSILIKDLERLQEYEFRVTYLGTDPTPNYGDVICCHVV
jgi:hypothetical protein